MKQALEFRYTSRNMTLSSTLVSMPVFSIKLIFSAQMLSTRACSLLHKSQRNSNRQQAVSQRSQKQTLKRIKWSRSLTNKSEKIKLGRNKKKWLFSASSQHQCNFKQRPKPRMKGNQNPQACPKRDENDAREVRSVIVTQSTWIIILKRKIHLRQGSLMIQKPTHNYFQNGPSPAMASLHIDPSNSSVVKVKVQIKWKQPQLMPWELGSNKSTKISKMKG